MEDLENQELLYALKQENAALEQKIQYLETIIEMHHVTKFDTNLGKLKLDIPTDRGRISSDGIRSGECGAHQGFNLLYAADH